jgi:uroporphyrinogen-III synthase
VTREAAQSERWVALLRGLKQQVSCVPCLERVKLPGVTLPLKPKVENWLFLTSEFAAQSVNWRRAKACLVAALPAAAKVARKRTKRVPVTATGGALELANRLCLQLQGASRMTLSEVGRERKPHVVYATSRLGTKEETHRQAVARLRAQATVSTAIVYQTRKPRGLSAALRAIPKAAVCALFFSPSAVRHFEMAFPARVKMTLSQVLCVGNSTVTAWNDIRRRGWPSGMAFQNAAQLEQFIGKECA